MVVNVLGPYGKNSTSAPEQATLNKLRRPLWLWDIFKQH